MRERSSRPKRHFRFLLALASALPPLAGAQTLSWVESDTAQTPSAFLDVATDAEGNAIAVGRFQGSFRMGGHVLESDAARSLFVARISRAGKVLWVRSIDAYHINAGWLAHAATDAAGNAILALYITEFDNPVRIVDSMVPNPWGPFLVKLDVEGRVAWIRTGYPSSSPPTAAFTSWHDLGTDALGNIYATGSIVRYASGFPSKNVFLYKFAPDGTPLWNFTPAGRIADLDDRADRCLAVPPRGGAYITMSSSMGNGAPLLVKVEEDGKPAWQDTLKPAEGIRSASRLALDPEGGVFLADTAATSLLFEDSLERSAPDRPLVLSRYSAAGEILWARRYPVASPPEGLAPAPWGGFVLAADRSAAQGLGPGDPDSADPAGGLLLAGFSSDGTTRWVQTVRGTGPGDGGLTGSRLAADAAGIFLVGNFSQALRVGESHLEAPEDGAEANTLANLFRIRWDMPGAGIRPAIGRAARGRLRIEVQPAGGVVSFSDGMHTVDARGRLLIGKP